MTEKIPRRLRRFYRNKQEHSGKEKAEEMSKDIFPQVHKKEISKKEILEKATKEVRKFREEKKRLPTEEEYSHIAEKIFNEIKKDYALKEFREKARHGAMQEKQVQSEKPLTPAEQRRIKRRMEREALEKKRAEMQAKEQKPERIEKRHQRRMREGQKTIEQQKPAQAEQPKIEGLSLKELLGEPKKKIEKKDELGELPLPEFGELEAIQPLEEEHVTKEIELRNSCPNCQAKTSHIIFCPQCGTAFCSHCAKTAVKEQGLTKYTCPKCNREVKLKD